MRRLSLGCFRPVSLALMLSTLVSAANAAETHSAFELNKTFLNTYCVSCHGDEKSEGDYNFEKFSDQDWNNQELIDEILMVVKEEEMPPEKAKEKPSAEDVAAFEKRLVKQYLTIKATLPGVLKRLNRTEYENTINDVFFTKFKVGTTLPVDNTRDGFDNQGDNLFMSPLAVDAYFRSASGIAEKVVGEMPKASTTVYRWDDHNIRRVNSHKGASHTTSNDRLTTEGFKHKDFCAAVKFADEVKPAGHYDVKINGHFTFYDTAIDFNKRDFSIKADVGRENERLEIERHMGNAPDPTFQSSQEFLLSEKVRVYLEPEMSLYLRGHNYFIKLPKDLGKLTRLPPFPAAKELRALSRTLPHLVSAEVTGPLYESWPPPNDFYNTYYKGLKGSDPHKQYQQFIRNLALKLFRRPVSNDDLDYYFGIAKKKYETDQNVFNAVQSALKMMLCSPNFLYKVEGDTVELDDYAIASRMSYFLWNSLPDDRLMKLASEGKLKDSVIRSAEALRMLQDPKLQRFAADFTTQWLKLDKIDPVVPNENILLYTFRDKGGGKVGRLKPFFKQESIEFFKLILNENLSLTNFIDSDFVVINKTLNQLYQLKKDGKSVFYKESTVWERGDRGDFVESFTTLGNKFAKVDLDEGSRRGGLLTQPGILMMTTNGEFTNPFYRGAWVAESIYGQELKTPANLEITALKAPTETFTIKDHINEHRKNPQCASCHSRMDPFGLAMENFDVLGRYRESYQKHVVTKEPYEEKKEGKVVQKERVTHKYVDTTKVEADTVHRDGRAINGIQGLKKLMLEDKDKIAKNLLTKLSQYAMGRRMNYADSEMIHRLLEESKKNDYKLRDLIVSIIADESFAKR
jgi:hypothetical protein